MNRTEKLKMLCSAADKAETLSIYDQIHIYVEMFNFVEVKRFAEPEIDRIREYLVNIRDYNMLDVMKTCFYNIGIEFNYQRPNHVKPTFYTNSQNVHVLAKSTENTALAIIRAYPSKYYRPDRFSSELYDFFFKSIEDFTYHSFEPQNLFASVYACIMSSENVEEMLIRLDEEIKESNGMCLTGCIVRLINSLRGFDIEFETTMDEYEHERSKSFYHLTKNIEETGLDTINLIPEIERIVNTKIIKLSRKFGTRILEAYTGVKWAKLNGKYYVK